MLPYVMLGVTIFYLLGVYHRALLHSSMWLDLYLAFVQKWQSLQ